MKALILQTSENSPEKRQQMAEAERNGTMPHWSVFDRTFNTTNMDLCWIKEATGFRRIVYRFLPKHLALLTEAFLHRHEYDVIITWMEQLSVAFAFAQFFTRRRVPHIALLYWMSKPDVKFLLRRVHNSILAIVTWSSVQRTFALNKLGIPPSKIHLIKHFVDPIFWRPMPDLSADDKSEVFICSAGAEMRDYPTLFLAVKDLPIHCYIAAREIRIVRRVRAKTWSYDSLKDLLPPNVTIRPYPATELRELYQRAKIVVVPLMPSLTDNGITVILEAMAMGKAIICSRTEGQKDALEDGVTGVLVEQGNPAALREAIISLLNDPARAEMLGNNAANYIKNSRHSLDDFSADVAKVVHEALKAHGGGFR